MSSQVEQIKERLNILDVVSAYVKLTKAGKNYKGRSPFSNEKTPSFFVSPERNMYYCFSTNQGGDIFTFVEKMEGVDFKGALKILAEKAGVELVHESKEVRDERERLYDALSKAEAFYHHNLTRNTEAREYLTKRGVSKELIERFSLGYAPHEWRALLEHLESASYQKEELVTAGLVKKAETEKKEVRYYDTFRGRVMFPIRDSVGRSVGFSGRILPQHNDGKTGKYINSPDTPLYNKSRVLFGYDLAKGSIKKFNFSILVEGQMDVVLSHQAGYSNTVAVSGTALTEHQLTLLSRLSKNIVMAFDADQAGFTSAGKSASLALRMGLDVKVAQLPEGVDPADLILEDPKKWKEAVRNSVHIIDFYLTYIREKGYDERKFKLEVQEKVFPLIAQISNKVDQSHFITRVSRAMNISEEVLYADLERMAGERELKSHQTQREGVASTQKPSAPESAEEKLAGIIVWQEEIETPSINVSELRESFIALLGEERGAQLLEKCRNKQQENIFKIELLYEHENILREDIEELLEHVRYRMTKKEFEETMEALRNAELSGDTQTSSKLLEKSQKIAEKLKSFVSK